jgi:hypothetical protein
MIIIVIVTKQTNKSNDKKQTNKSNDLKKKLQFFRLLVINHNLLTHANQLDPKHQHNFQL